MSLRVRLMVLIVALVALVSLALSAFYLNYLVNSLSADAFDRSTLAIQQVKAFVLDQITQHSDEYEIPRNLEETKTQWNDIVAGDRDIPKMLEKMLTLSPTIVEINIVGQTGQILTSSDPQRAGGSLARLELLSEWRNRPLRRRLADLVNLRSNSQAPDFQLALPLGITGQASPVFMIQVVVSSILIRRETMLPQIGTLAEVSGGALLVSLLVTMFTTNLVLRPLKRIEGTIDRIVQGNFLATEADRAPSEFAAVEGKLNLLGERFRGAREEATELQHNLDALLNRMASQLDVATRLAAISRITGGVAHEIKNPLNAISLRLDLLRARLGEPEEELVAEIDILSKEVTRLDRVVKTFLDFSRPVEVRFEEVDLTSVAHEVAELMTPQARFAGVSMYFEAPPERACIRGDADMLKQAVLNLVINAIEAMKSGGNLRVSVSRDGDGFRLDVSDDGPGIPADMREKVFQLYFTTKQRGSGIGLAMTFRTVQLHNGTISFSSDSERGTIFRLNFPALVRHA